MRISPGIEQIDPALIAFVKCHVTSPVKWEALRTLATQNGGWFGIEQLARAIHKHPALLANAMAELTAEGVIEQLRSGLAEDVSFRLPPSEPTSVVLRRLIDEATRNQELRAIMVAYWQRGRLAASAVPAA